MDLSATDLNNLYKCREVNRISTFGDVAAQLSIDDIVSSYIRARDLAPRRHDHDKKYFVDHSGLANRSEDSNRGEEHLALALWGASRSVAPMVLPGGGTLEIIDYQTPLKAQRRDAGVGKVDLMGLIDNGHLAVIELKVRPGTERYGDTPLRAYLEALAYCAIVEANITEIASEAGTRFSKSIDDRPPALIVMAPQDYWAGYLEHPKAGHWSPILSGLAAEIDALLGLETHFLGLRDAAIRMGSKGQNPQFTGNCSIVGATELAAD